MRAIVCAALLVAAIGVTDVHSKSPLHRLKHQQALQPAHDHAHVHAHDEMPRFAGIGADATVESTAAAGAGIALPGGYHYPMMVDEPNPPAWSVPSTAACRTAASQIRTEFEKTINSKHMLGVMITTTAGAQHLYVASSGEDGKLNAAVVASAGAHGFGGGARTVHTTGTVAIPAGADDPNIGFQTADRCAPKTSWGRRDYPDGSHAQVLRMHKSRCTQDERDILLSGTLAAQVSAVGTVTAALTAADDALTDRRAELEAARDNAEVLAEEAEAARVLELVKGKSTAVDKMRADLKTKESTLGKKPKAPAKAVTAWDKQRRDIEALIKQIQSADSTALACRDECQVQAHRETGIVVQRARDAYAADLKQAEGARDDARRAAITGETAKVAYAAFTGAQKAALARLIDHTGFAQIANSFAALPNQVDARANADAGKDEGNPVGQCAGTKLARLANGLSQATTTVDCIAEIWCAPGGNNRGDVTIRTYTDGANPSTFGEYVPSCSTCRQVMRHYLLPANRAP